MQAFHYLGTVGVIFVLFCDCIVFCCTSYTYGNRSKLYTGSYEIINFKDFKAL